MKTLITTVAIFVLSISCKSIIVAQESHHKLSLSIDIQESFIDVTDTIYLKNNSLSTFYLNQNLQIYDSNCKLVTTNLSDKKYTQYAIKQKSNAEYLVIKYKGKIQDNKSSFVSKDKGMMHGTEGLIFNGGIYLTGSSYWVPHFNGAGLLTFEVNVNINKEWGLVSQGNLLSEELIGEKKLVHFKMDNPTNQVCIIGNKWKKYTTNVAGIGINVYLLKEDQSLSQRYLGITGKYLNMYNKLIGEFPYKKFDVVENFWETGYGMPSFTLLGQKVMRFPWILNTSYPHELLHNYWGNGVYVDYEKGNWSEGLTTYMADYLLKEIEGNGAQYRRTTLKKYSDYVNDDNDIPIEKFTSKFDKASEAIGYSKVLMINHMLRKKYGSEMFLKVYADFYKKNKFKTASFEDIQNTFEDRTGDNLDYFFSQWIHQTGAPELSISNVEVSKRKDNYELSFNLKQKNTTQAFNIDIPAFIYLEDQEKVSHEMLSLKKIEQSYTLSFDKKPVRIDIDPNYDVMRRLGLGEVPASLSALMGQKQWTVILPKNNKFYENYKALAQSWTTMYSRRGKVINVVDDVSLTSIPQNNSVWVLGKDNKFAQLFDLKGSYGNIMDKQQLSKLEQLNAQDGTVVYTLSNSENSEMAVGYINASNPSTISQIAMKLMHYGNYSFLGFEGENLKNTIKGNFPVLNSPLNYVIDKEAVIDWGKMIFPEQDLLVK